MSTAYIYAADIYCEGCALALRDIKGDDRDLDRSQSDDWPQGPYDDGGGEADSPQHCGCGPDCVNALDINGTKVGCWLENPLTAAGVHYVIEAVKEGGEVAALWAAWYKEELENDGFDVAAAIAASERKALKAKRLDKRRVYVVIVEKATLRGFTLNRSYDLIDCDIADVRQLVIGEDQVKVSEWDAWMPTQHRPEWTVGKPDTDFKAYWLSE